MSYTQRSLLNLLAILPSRSTGEKITVGKNMRSGTLQGSRRHRKVTKNRAFSVEWQECVFWHPICDYWMAKGDAFACPFSDEGGFFLAQEGMGDSADRDPPTMHAIRR